MRNGYGLLIVVVVAFMGYGIYNTVKTSEKIITKRAEAIDSILSGR